MSSTYPNSGSFSITNILPNSTVDPSQTLSNTQFGFSDSTGQEITISDNNWTDITTTSSYTTNTPGPNFTLSDATIGEITYNGPPSYIEMVYFLSINVASGTTQTEIGCFIDSGSGYQESGGIASGSETYANVPSASTITMISKFIRFFNTGTKFKLRIKNEGSTDNYRIYTSIITAKNFAG